MSECAPRRMWKREEILAAFAAKEQSVADRATKLPNLTCFIDQFPLAMAAIANVHDYARGPLVKGDYRPSMLRHLFKIGEHPDHDAAAVWNAMAQLEIKLRTIGKERNDIGSSP